MEEARFRAALDAVLAGVRQLELHYQPIVDLRRATVVGYEALARFPGPPQLSPDRWLQGAQGRGKRGQLENLMMRRAIEARDLLPPDTFLSLNVSPIFLLSRDCETLLQEAGDLTRLVLEITEAIGFMITRRSACGWTRCGRWVAASPSTTPGRATQV